MSDLFGHGRVRISPDLTGFRSELEAGVAASVAQVPVPSIAPAATSSAAAQTAALNVQQAKAAGATAVVSAETKALAHAYALAAVAAEKLRESEVGQALPTGDLTALKHRLAAANTLVTDTEKAQQAAMRTTSATLIALTDEYTALAAAEQAAAAAAVKSSAAIAAESTHAAVAARGAGTEALAALGLRGATLAASGPFLAGAAAATVLVKSISAAASFERQLNVLQSVAHATDEQMKDLSKTAVALGQDLTLPGVSANDAAAALTDLARAGFGVEESVKAVRGALLLSVASQTDVATAVELTAKTLDAFGLAGDQSVRVVDNLTNAANTAEGTVADFAAALAQVGPVAQKGGLSLENTTALLAEFAKGGFTGAAAGTALRQALVRLENPSNQAAALIKLLKIQLRDAQDNIRPDVFVQFADATRGLGKGFADSAAATVFGARAVKAFDIAAREGADGLAKAQAAQQRQGSTADQARAQTEGLSGSIEDLKKSANSLGREIGSGLTGPVKILVGDLSDLAHGLDIAITKTSEFINTITGGHLKDAVSEIVQFSIGQVNPIVRAQQLLRGFDVAKELVGGPSIDTQVLRERFKQIEATSVSSIASLISNLRQAAKDGAKDIQSSLSATDLGNIFEGLFSKLDLSGPAGNTARKMAAALIDQLKKMGPAGAAELEQLGLELGHGITVGFTAAQKDTIAAANQAVRDAMEQGQKEVEQAVISAKTNLGSIAQQLASSVGQVLDARAEAAIASLDRSALGREIQALTAELDKTTIAQGRADILFQIGSATDDASRRSAIAQLQQFDLRTKLDTDKKKLESEKETIEKVAAAQKKAINESLIDLANEAAQGSRNAASFTNQVFAELEKAIPNFQEAGKGMSRSLRDTIGSELTALTDQAKALQGFTSTAPGGTNQTNVVKPAEVLAQSQRNISDALHARGKTLAELNAQALAVLKQIRDGRKATETPTGSAGGTRGGSGASHGARQAAKVKSS